MRFRDRLPLVLVVLVALVASARAGASLSTYLDLDETSAPSLAGAGVVRLYASSSDHTVKISANGGAFSTSITAANLSASLPSSVLLDGGNTTGATVTLGTNDAQSLALESNNTARLTVSTTAITAALGATWATGGSYSTSAPEILGPTDAGLFLSAGSATAGNPVTLTGGAATGATAAGSITGTAGQSATGTAGAITWTAGAGGSSSGNGGIASLIGGAGTASNATGGVSRLVGGAGQGSAAGGAAQVTGGAGGATGAGGAITITAGAGGATSGAAGAITLAGGTPVSGAGGGITLTASNGVASNNVGGTLSGTAGNAVGSGTAGSVTWTAGRSVTGTAGAATVTAGQGGSTSGAGGIAGLVGGAGAAGNAAGGVARVIGGAGQGSAAGGAAQLTGGAGGATGAGGALTLTSGAGGATSGAAGAINLTGGTPTDGNGGTITLTASNGVGTNRNGGTVNLVTGTATGSGTAGTIQFSGVTVWANQAQTSMASDTTTIAQYASSDAIIDKLIVPTINERSLEYQFRPTGTARNYSPTLGVGTVGASFFVYSFSEAEASDAALGIHAGSTAVTIQTMSLSTVIPLTLSHYDNAGAGTTTDYLILDPADVSLTIGVSGGKMGFFGLATPISKPTVTGSRGGNAALADLLTELQNLGLIVDSSS